MQLALRRIVVAALVVVAAPRLAHAENRVTIRGAYFREPSTRVVQPVVQISKDLPDRADITAYYLLDAITSASVAAGNTQDEIFTEFRNEAGLSFGKTLGAWRAHASYRYSAESDYWAHGLSLALGRSLWDDTGTLTATVGRGFDRATSAGRTPGCVPKDGAGNPMGFTCPLDLYFGGLGYLQVLSPTMLGELRYETSFLDGNQANLYRSVPNHGYENLPRKRLRHSATLRFAKFWPTAGSGIQLQYRFYYDQYPGFADDKFPTDPWHVMGHTAEVRLFQELGRDLTVRLSYRYYRQTAADMWCDWRADSGCYRPDALVYSTDPKLEPMNTQLPEAKLFWDAHPLAGVPFLGWFASGTFEISYGYLMQSTSYANAHLLQMGYSMPY